MPRQHRRHSTAIKRQVVEEYHAGETLHALSKRHDICRQLIRVWIEKHEARAYDDGAGPSAWLGFSDARIAALERLVGRQALEMGSQRGLRETRPRREAGRDPAITGPKASHSNGGAS